MTTPTPRTVWLLAAPVPNDGFSPDVLLPYGAIRSVFRARESAYHRPEEAFARLYNAFRKEFRPGDYIAWMGGDTLIVMLAGAALMAAEINEWTWLRYIGRGEYQTVPIVFDGTASPATESQMHAVLNNPVPLPNPGP